MTQQNKTNKKAQEEIVGFVLIMLLVAVIFLVFLGIYLRGASKVHESEGKDIASFLEAVSKITVECEYVGDPSDLSNLIIDCSDDSTATCLSNGKNKCAVLRDTLFQAINSTWNFNQNSPTKGYSMQILRETSTGEVDLFQPPLLPLMQIPLSQKEIRSADKPFPKGIIMRLEIYY
jgi:hypothetical protein